MGRNQPNQKCATKYSSKLTSNFVYYKVDIHTRNVKTRQLQEPKCNLKLVEDFRANIA